jgi:uncharacterized protein YeaO (DUF488 family)
MVAMVIKLKRAYEEASRADGARVLVDRLWPRGVKKDEAEIQLWLKDLAPSNELRTWFHARPERWEAFRERYLQELRESPAAEALGNLYDLTHKRKRVTLIFGAKDEEHNNAVVLKQLLEGMKKPPAHLGAEAAAVPSRGRARRRA